ncbi:MAG: helix-turn-helix transcriptional regulator [Planctomycetota bacterium]
MAHRQFAPETASPADLLAAFGRIPEPENYFAGVRSAHPELPDNLLLFGRDAPLLGHHSYHHRYVLICNLQAEGAVIVDGAYLRFQPGEAVLVLPHQFHHFAGFAADRIAWLFITFELSRPGRLEVCRYRTLPLSAEARRTLGRLMALFPAIRTAVDADESLLLAGLLLQHLRRAAETGAARAAAPAAGPHAALVEAVGAYVHANLERPFTIRDAADAVAVSESHLRAVFRQVAGVSFGRYIRQARLHRAGGLLVAGELNVTEVAERCGYESLYAFSRAFKEATGESPTAWRARLRARQAHRPPRGP